MNYSWDRPSPARRIQREDALLAVGYAALAWLLHSLDLTATGSPLVPGLAPWWPALTVIGCAAVLLRRRQTAVMVTVCFAAAVALVLANSAAGLFLAFEAVFSLVLFGSARAARAAEVSVLVLCGASGAAAWALTGDLRDGVTVILLTGMVLLLPAEWASNLRKAAQLAESESARAAAIRSAARDQERLAAREHELALAAERQDMARELHDVLSSRLSAIALQSGAALRSPAGSSLPVEVLGHVRRESVKGLEELNGMIRTLSSGVPRPLAGSVLDLDAVVDGHRAAGMEVSWSNRLDRPEELPSPLQAAVYRIAVEALVNAARHTDGARVRMLLERAPGGIRLVVQDDGGSHPGRSAGSPALAGTGTGVPSMLARAGQLGGRAWAGPAASGRGWTVEATLPADGSQLPEPLPGQGNIGTEGTKV
ncbi:sensor histidine kinase [Arthrobacter caoxuetaonis]|uniref:histidine kinase n=1 Tax=Arthrobacter caoxuetaonis TaxID=2886935 RepID=A0A9X1SB32_9MICC|nr:histidine kinase [Arthrobacter caoxuetaonis]MCC3297355.1 histidine kinase [Arthrobacter caoxuetaonis]USQ58105.1 histidine kinase [Arthrobacter caoxuetaonis]